MARLRNTTEERALAAALRYGCPEPSAEEITRARRVLSPHVNVASIRLKRIRAERRAVRLQALALAGCSAVFAALAALLWSNRQLLLAKPLVWAAPAGVLLLLCVVAGMLPLLLMKKGDA